MVTLVPCTIFGLLLFFGFARVLKLLSEEDRSFVAYLLPTRLGWVVKLLWQKRIARDILAESGALRAGRKAEDPAGHRRLSVPPKQLENSLLGGGGDATT